MTDNDLYIQRLLDGEPLRKPLFKSIIRNLDLPAGSQGLDVGCGIGLQALLLSEVVGLKMHVTGLDILPDFLVYGTDLAKKSGFSEQICMAAGDAGKLPFTNDSFDWVWSADCIGYPSGDLLPLLSEMIRVTKPGGEIVILAWTSQQVLPGYPLLEARLNADCSSYAPYLKGKQPDQHFLRALHWFREAGLENVRAQSFIGEVQSPLNTGERAALLSLFEMLWQVPQTSPLNGEYQRLCNPASPEFILDIPGYYAFFTYTLFRGSLPANN